MSEESRYLRVVVEMANRFAEKDAEIEWLKGELKSAKETFNEDQKEISVLEAKNAQHRQLITELCDALTVETRGDDWDGNVYELIQRAREASEK